ncbi:uncharacterized protein LOC112004418 isoform X3 [Quercus suber]|uniref:uncharacterized protein LOC112004418 isoform X3 n=1 Tax=Quercus suber TaxID=58331 RepID=UPI0032DF3760
MLESFFHSARLRRNREDPWLKPQAEEFYGMKECEVGEAITTRYEDITNTLDQVELKTMVHIDYLQWMKKIRSISKWKHHQQYQGFN